MEAEKITIICPQCKKKTRVPNIGLPTRGVTCANCKYKGSLMLFQIVNTSQPAQPAASIKSSPASGATLIEQPRVAERRPAMPPPRNGATIIETPQAEPVPAIGYLQVASTNQKYTLSQGTNIIGRQHPTSQATIQIATNDGYMSRQHMKIDVFPAGNKLEHRLSDNNSTNKVTLNGKQLNPGDIIILRPGDKITIGHTDLLFMI